MSRDLAQHPCRSLCSWRPAEGEAPAEGTERLFRCRGCGSEWRRGEAWAPVDADGRRHPELVAEIARRKQSTRSR